MKRDPYSPGSFRLKGPISSGRGGTTYLAGGAGKARHPRWVLKGLPWTEGGSPGSRLRPDFPDLACLRHPSLALPLSVCKDPRSERFFLVRAYIPGSEISLALKGRLPRDSLPWMLAAAEALAILHRFRIPHRNLKASNLIVPAPGLFSRPTRDPKVILCDPAYWCAGEEGASSAAQHSTSAALAAGDPSFASDLYSLGSVFYEIFAGNGPRPGDDGFIAPLSEVRPEVPIDFGRVVMKLLHPDPARRYREAGLLAEDLRRLEGVRSGGRFIPPECFLGRRDELERARERLAERDRSPGSMPAPAAIAVTGEGGAGKSAFLRRLSLEAQLLGYRTVSASCYFESGMPFTPLSALAEQLIPAGTQGRPSRARYRRLIETNQTAPTWRDCVEPEPGPRNLFLRGFAELLSDLAASQPTLLLVDDVHLADKLAVECLAYLTGEIGASWRQASARGRAPPSLAVSYRVESPFRAAVAPLVEAFGQPGQGHLVFELPPLSRETVEEWIALSLGGTPREAMALEAAPALRGHPFSIREAVRIDAGAAGEGPAPPPDLPGLHRRYLASLGKEARGALKVLAVLGCPASAELIEAVLDGPGPGLRLALRSLLSDGTLVEEGAQFFFQHRSFQEWLLEVVKRSEKRFLHERIARVLSARARRSPGGAADEEIARHWLASKTPAMGVGAALKAARELVRRHEDRGALSFYRAVLDLLPVARRSQRQVIAQEAADAHARAGEHRRAVEILEKVLGTMKPEREAARIHARIGIFCHRAGDLEKAAPHLARARKLLRRARGARGLEERLRIECELAEIASNKGDYPQAEEICRAGLVEAARIYKRASGGARREEMVLLETLAHIKLRRFQYAEARTLFEKSLRLAEDLGSVPEKSLILNNLGILHIQENRFREAIACYEQAGKHSMELGQDQILVNIESNLALLHAKAGDPEAADHALERAAKHDARCESTRTRFLRLHSSGLVDLCFGRYAAAIETLAEAIELGRELGDSYLVAFDLVYLGECHLFRGEWKAARAAFGEALASPPGPPPVASMVNARAALLAALRGDTREAKARCAATAGGPASGIGQIEAWNRLFLGWASRILKRPEAAGSLLESARAFFASTGVPAGEIHAQLELAALDADGGRFVAARKSLAALREKYACGRGPLKNPMLSARFLALEARLFLEGASPDVEQASSILVEAESFLIGHHIRDLEVLIKELKRRARQARQGSDRISTGSPAARDPGAVPLPKLKPAAPRAGSIVGRSAPIRELRRLVRQVAPSSLPVLISGETGTGKEVVARAIHGESPRRAGPFLSINCAALPQELLEAELFGYKQGAFTGAEQDRAGLLVGAQGGTLLFDEIGEMPLAVQGKILRVLERGQVRPLGASEEVGVDVRYLFTTNRNARALMEEGRLRRDLFFRVSAFEITVPPLRERVEDIPLLIELFSRSNAEADPKKQVPSFDEDARRALAAHPWPGNARELENAIRRLALTASGAITAAEVASFLGKPHPRELFGAALLRSRSLDELLVELERAYLIQLGADHGGNVRSMAGALGITERALFKRFRRLRIRTKDLM